MSIIRVNGEVPGSGLLFSNLFDKLEKFPVEINRIFPMPYCDEAEFFTHLGIGIQDAIAVSRSDDQTTIALLLSKVMKNHAEGICLLVYPQYEKMEMTVYCNQVSEAEAAIAKIKGAAESFKPPKKRRTQFPMSFCSQAMNGFSHLDRMIDCPKWQSIEANYPNLQAKEALKISNIKAGKLIFWHGRPGTGKTYLIRTLIRSWSDKADFLYIMDPERLFNDASYMLSLLTNNERGPVFVPRHKRKFKKRIETEETERNRFQVLILEDTLDLLLAENRGRIGPAISRLLNLTEGIIGQGFRTLLLMTTNEPVTNIDPAFLRPGRCAQSLEFPLFSPVQAEAWATKNKCQVPVKKRHDHLSLAELYALKNNQEIELDNLAPKEIGFKEVK